MYILRILFFPLSLSKHWHFSCWFLTFVDRDLILSNILDLLFLQWFPCTSTARLRWLGMCRALRTVATMHAASFWTAAVLASIHPPQHTSTLHHAIYNQPKLSRAMQDFHINKDPILLTTLLAYTGSSYTGNKTNIFFFLIQSSLMQEWRKKLQCLDSGKDQCTNGKQCCAGLRSALAVLSEKLFECWW